MDYFVVDVISNVQDRCLACGALNMNHLAWLQRVSQYRHLALKVIHEKWDIAVRRGAFDDVGFDECLVQGFRQKICIELFGGEAKVHKNVESVAISDDWFLAFSEDEWSKIENWDFTEDVGAATQNMIFIPAVPLYQWMV